MYVRDRITQSPVVVRPESGPAALRVGGADRQAALDAITCLPELEFVAAITRGSVEGMNLKVGDEVYAVVKATEMMVAKD